jgi:hypothetical protein
MLCFDDGIYSWRSAVGAMGLMPHLSIRLLSLAGLKTMDAYPRSSADEIPKESDL